MTSAASTAPGSAAGMRFGRFVAVQPIGGGGMSELYLAVGGQSPDPVVVKRLLPHLCWDAEFVRMFLDEVRIAAGLDHPNVVRVVDYGVADGGHFFAMEYLHGRNVRDVLHDAGAPLPLDVALGIVLGVAAGLHYAHTFVDEEGVRVEVVHRDVSPSNVLVTYDGAVKLVDFGIARVTAHTRQTRAGTIKGKIGYMSPEQCRGGNIDRRTDVFGLGILLYELTVHRRAFYADNDYAVMNRIIDGDVVRPTEIWPQYPPQLEAVVLRALAVEPGQRYQTVAAFIEALQAIASAQGLEVGETRRSGFMRSLYGQPAPPSLSVPEPVAATPTRSMRPMAIMAAVGVLLGVGGFALGGYLRADPTSAAAPPSDPAQTSEAAPAAVAPPVARVVADPEPTPPESEAIEPAPVAEAAPVAETPPPQSTAKPKRRRAKRRRPKRSTKSADSTKAAGGGGLLPPSWRDP